MKELNQHNSQNKINHRIHQYHIYIRAILHTVGIGVGAGVGGTGVGNGVGCGVGGCGVGAGVGG